MKQTGQPASGCESERRDIEARVRRLERKLEDANRELAILRESVAGGMACLFPDDSATIISLSDSLLAFLGFDWEEVSDMFGNAFFNLIPEGEREGVREDVRAQLATGDDFVFESHLRRKSGPAWVCAKGQVVRDDAGNAYCHCTVIDNSGMKEAEASLRDMEQRYRAVVEMNDSLVFEYNYDTSRVYIPMGATACLGISLPGEEFDLDEMLINHVYPEDVSKLAEVVRRGQFGSARESVELRARRDDGSYFWCRLRSVTVYHEHNRPVKAICILSDIDNQVKEAETLKTAAQEDPLTHLYNKLAFETLARKLMEINPQKTKHALFVIDIDDFKHINDSLGHLHGDEVLRRVARRIKSQFRAADIVGRVGGDEFAVLLNKVENSRVIVSRMKAIQRSVYEVRAGGKPVTCSIGVAVFPQDGETFRVLFSNADSALYTAKHKGKNCYQIYNNGMKMGHSMAWPKEDGGPEDGDDAAVDGARGGPGRPG